MIANLHSRLLLARMLVERGLCSSSVPCKSLLVLPSDDHSLAALTYNGQNETQHTRFVSEIFTLVMS